MTNDISPAGRVAANQRPTIRATEFFAGVGGFACAAARVWSDCELDITAIDIDQTAKVIYELNHPHQMMTCEIESLEPQSFHELPGDMWWLSPPCQPYSRRGNQRDVQDPRAASLVHLIAQIERARPRSLALENVASFAESRAFDLLNEALARSSYQVMHRLLCPTEMGWPNRRPRFYLVASLDPLRDWDPLPHYHHSVSELVEGALIDRSQCSVQDAMVSRFLSGMHRVDLSQSECITACFGSSYGKSFLHAGSYAVDGEQWRRFAPTEVARLLGFPSDFTLPEPLGYRRLWQLLGNSLSIPAVEYVLEHVPLSPARSREAGTRWTG